MMKNVMKSREKAKCIYIAPLTTFRFGVTSPYNAIAVLKSERKIVTKVTCR